MEVLSKQRESSDVMKNQKRWRMRWHIFGALR
jgi:hypothetical protein